MALIQALGTRHLRGDLFGGVTAAVVALPLALAFGVSSGAGAITGLYGAIMIGFFASLFGGTPSQISGPTGPMTVVMVGVITHYIALDAEYGLAMAFTVVVMAGFFQILFGIMRVGKYITLMPYSVISGFMSGIGFIIIILQTAPLLGHSSAGGIIDSIRAMPAVLQGFHFDALWLGLLTLCLLSFWPSKLQRFLPSSLGVLVIVTLVSLGIPNDAVNRIGEIPMGLPTMHWPHFSWVTLKDMVSSALLLAALGSVDSLLTSLVADNMTHEHHDSDKELIGQGLGNIMSGLFGGLPGAGATMRTVTNINAGGKTAVSGLTHSAVLLLLVVGCAPLAAPIPHAVLAGVLLKVGIDIIDWRFLKRCHVLPKETSLLMFLVLILTVFVDLITAVVVGVFVANLLTVRRLTDLQLKSIKVTDQGSGPFSLTDEEKDLMNKSHGKVLLLRLKGPMSFGVAKALSHQFSKAHKYSTLVLDFSRVPFMDPHTCMAIEDIVVQSLTQERSVLLIGLSHQVQEHFEDLGVMDKIPQENIHVSRIDALRHAEYLVRREN